MRNSVFLKAGLAAVFVLAAPAASAGTKDRVEALEAAVSELQASSPAALGTSQRVDQLEAQVRSLTGQIEELGYRLDQMDARLQVVTAVLAGDQAVAGAPGGPVDLVSGDPIANEIARADEAGPGVSIPLDPDAAYVYATDFLLGGDYARAQQAYTLFLDAYPNHPRSSDAKFRLGEVYLATGQNAEAADTFIAFIKTYPASPRSAEAYLKLGTAFSRLEQTTEACKIFKTLKSKYPTAAPAVLQRTDVEMARIDCR